MAKTRWVTDTKIDSWFEAEMCKLDEWAGTGSAIEALGNFIEDKYYMSLHYEDMKEIDIHDYVNGGIGFGQNAEHMDLKIFSFYYDGINFYILAKNKTQFKQMVKKALNDYRESCDPIEEEEDELPFDDVATSLLKDIYAHIKDPKGQNELEKNWCKRIEKMGLDK